MAGIQIQSDGTRGNGRRELAIVIGIVAMVLAGVGVLYWMRLATQEVAGAGPMVVAAKPAARLAAPAQPDTAVIHADIYFDFKSTRLRAEGATLLQDKAAAMRHDQIWVVLVHGYTDAQGPVEYNRRLAQRRAETVKLFLVELGVPETSVKTVTVGPEGALCDDLGKECQQLNRRVHLEMRRLGPVTMASTPAFTVDRDQVQEP